MDCYEIKSTRKCNKLPLKWCEYYIFIYTLHGYSYPGDRETFVREEPGSSKNQFQWILYINTHIVKIITGNGGINYINSFCVHFRIYEKLHAAVLIQYLLFSPSTSCQFSTINKCQYFLDISETYKCEYRMFPNIVLFSNFSLNVAGQYLTFLNNVLCFCPV